MSHAHDPDEKIEVYSVEDNTLKPTQRVVLPESEWRQKLDDEQFRVLRKHGTERAFAGDLWDNKEAGVYRCAACANDLFHSDTKFDSGTGWPSFSDAINEANIETESDNSLFMRRTEVLCSRCDSHLGHVFEDGPEPTGMRYCINSAALDFAPMEGDDQ